MSLELANGQPVSVGCGEEVVRGKVALVSENQKSVMVELESGVRLGEGVYLNFLPLLMNDAGEYQDLLQGVVVRLSAVEEGGCPEST